MKKAFLPFLVAVCVLRGTITGQTQTNYEPYPFSTIAGLAGTAGSANGTGSAARFNSPAGIATDSAANVYVADTTNHTIRKITPAGVVTTLAGLAGSSGSANGTGSAARFNFPSGVAVDANGNLYVADSNNHTIRKITAAGVVTTVAGLAGSSGSSDGTGSNARFNFPNGIAVNSSGNLYVSDTSNHTIRKITSAGVVTTLAGLAGSGGLVDATGSAARFSFPDGLAVDAISNVYVADRNNSAIRKITPAAVVTTLAGSTSGELGSNDGSGDVARFRRPGGIAVDSAGNVYVADSENSTIRKITPAFTIVRTLAGLAGNAGSANGTGNIARFNIPFGVAVGSNGKVYVADTLNHTIRSGGPAPSTPTQTFSPDPGTMDVPIPHPSEVIGTSNAAFNQSATFTNLPAFTSFSVSFDITHPAPGDYLKVTIFPGRLAQTSRPFPGVPVFVLFNRERLVNAAGQLVTHFQRVVSLPQTVNGKPFLGSDTYTVQVLNDTYSGATTNTGMFNACSLTLNPSNPGHVGPPTLTLRKNPQPPPLPAQVNINYGDPLVLLATAVANPSSTYTIERLGIVISPSPAPSASPSPQPQPTVYRSNVVFQATPSSSGVGLTYSAPILPPGDYQIAAAARDSAGFAQGTSSSLKVNRLFGIFGVSVTSRHVNTDSTIDFGATLTLRNTTQSTSANLRVRLVSVASATFRDADGPPPNLNQFPPMDLTPIYAINPLLPGGSKQLNVSGQVRAPFQNTVTGPDRFINFDIFAVLENLVQNQWFSVDSTKVVDGVHFFPGDTGGPGGGVNDPPPTLTNSAFDPYVLESVKVTGSTSVNDTATTHYTATATARNSAGPINTDVTTYSDWSVSPAPPFTISDVGVLQPTHLYSNKTASISAKFTFGGVTRTSPNLAVTVHATSPPLQGDFNSDAYTDFLLFSPSTRRTVIWDLHGAAHVGGAYGPTLPLGWVVGCVADINRDGKPDYVLYNTSTRATAIWFLNNATLLSSAYGPTLPSGWAVVAATDFNNDSQPDYVLFNASSGRTAFWYLSSSGALTGSAYGPILPPGWTLVDALDFNANGKPDLLLSNTSTLRSAIWYLTGTAHTTSAYGPTLPSGWTLKGAADFTSDGKPDYVLYQASTQHTALWYLNGATRTGTAYGPTVAAGYILASP